MFKAKNNEINGRLINILKSKPSLCHPDKPLQARGLCKNCYDKWLKENNPEYCKRQKENTIKWINNNKEYYKKYKENWIAKQDPLYIKQYKRMKTLEKYGMNFEEYDNMIKLQKGVCAICKMPPKDGKNLHIDHDHVTGIVRGLLCFRCNFGLSYFKEDKNIIKNLYEYMTNTKSS